MSPQSSLILSALLFSGVSRQEIYTESLTALPPGGELLGHGLQYQPAVCRHYQGLCVSIESHLGVGTFHSPGQKSRVDSTKKEE